MQFFLPLILCLEVLRGKQLSLKQALKLSTDPLLSSEILWLLYILKFLKLLLSSPPLLYCDSLSTLYMTSNPVLHNRSKHIEIELHFIREKVSSVIFYLRHLPSIDQIAHLFTKPLFRTHFELNKSKLQVTPKE